MICPLGCRVLRTMGQGGATRPPGVGKKRAAPRGAAEFREETSKKDSNPATLGCCRLRRYSLMLHCTIREGRRLLRVPCLDLSAAGVASGTHGPRPRSSPNTVHFEGKWG